MHLPRAGKYRYTGMCILYEKGQIIIDKEECDMDGDDLMMLALDAGAEDFSDADDSFEITTAPEDFDAVHKALEEQNIPMASAEVTMIPQTYVTLTDEADITNIGRILDFLDDDDDVQEVYHNWEDKITYCKNASYAKQGFKLGGRYEENLICSIRMCSFY